MMKIAQVLGSYISEARFKDLPSEVIDKAKALILDLLGCGLVGTTADSSRKILRVFADLGGKKEATVWGGGQVPALHAALINGSMAHAFELDDTHRQTYYHAGAAVIPAAMAAAEMNRSSGRDFILGVVAGYEVSIRVALAVNPSHRLRGFHTTGTVGTFGAAAAAAKVLRLTDNEAAAALGLAGTQAAGLFEFVADGSMSKRFHPGKSAQNGLLAALLAAEGFTGPVSIFEGQHGFCRTQSDNYDLEQLTAGLGKIYRILEVGIKPHASCRFCHNSIDAALEITSRDKLTPQEIKKIEIQVSKLCAAQTGDLNPQTFLAAQMSTPFSVALAVVKGGANYSDYLAGLKDPEIREVLQKTAVLIDPELDEFSREATVRIIKHDDSVYEAKVKLAAGEPEKPLSKAKLQEKFLGLSQVILPEAQGRAIMQKVGELEWMKDLTPLAAELGR